MTVQTVIPSYLYQEYQDDDDLEAFVIAFNQLAQGYVDWFNTINLPVYTAQTGLLLDWIAQGVYGLARPTIPYGIRTPFGTFNTAMFNGFMYNQFDPLHFLGVETSAVPTTDDVFKRVITWHYYKGDGKTFDIRWLKRRVMRFLLGANGTDPPVTDTYRVSVTFGVGQQVNINIITVLITVLGGAIYNKSQFNAFGFNQSRFLITPLPAFAMGHVFKAAVDAGILELPFQFTYVVEFN